MPTRDPPTIPVIPIPTHDLRPGANPTPSGRHERPITAGLTAPPAPPAVVPPPGKVRAADAIGRAIECPGCHRPVMVEVCMRRTLPPTPDPDFVRTNCRTCGGRLSQADEPVVLIPTQEPLSS